jgi:hypothetical protein
MKITIEPSHQGQGHPTVVIDNGDDDIVARDAAEVCKRALIAWGYLDESVSEIFNLE